MFFKTAFLLASPPGNRARLSILIFHRVLAESDPLFPDVPCVEQFEKIIGWIKEWFNVLPLEDAVNRLKHGLLPERAAAVTFDDGYADNFLHAVPILKKYGLHATVFVATGFLDGRMMWNDKVIESIRNTATQEIDATSLDLGYLSIRTIEQKRLVLDKLLGKIKFLQLSERTDAVNLIQECCKAPLPNDLMLTTAQLLELHRSGMGVGAHTVNHPILTRISDNDARKEIADNRDQLEGILRESVNLFAYPNGKVGRDYSANHVDIVKEIGFSAAFTTNWGAYGRMSDVFQMPRFSPWDTGRFSYAMRLIRNFSYPDASLKG